MREQLTKHLKVKSLEEILCRLKELVHRHRRRFLKRNLRPCPLNCVYGFNENRRFQCSQCKSRNSQKCRDEDKFVPISTKEELYQQFKEELRDPSILVKNYRDIAVLFWVLEADEKLIEEVEKK